MDTSQTKPRKRYRATLRGIPDQSAIEDRAWGSVFLCSVALIAFYLLSSYDLIPEFLSGFAMGCTTLNLLFSLYAATGTR